MSGVITATAIAGVAGAGAGLLGASTATALAVAGLGFSAVSGLEAAKAKPAQASGVAAENQVTESQNEAMQSRTALLETAGGSAGAPLAPGQVSNNSTTIFGN